MRFGIIQDRVRCACLDKALEDVSSPAFFISNKCIQLSVGESPCAALAELDVRLGIKDSCFPEMFDVTDAVFYFSSSFQKNWLQSALRKHKRTEQSRRTRADDDGTGSFL